MRELTVNESRKFIDGVSRVHIGSFSFVAGRGRSKYAKHGVCWHIDHFRITWRLYTNSPRVIVWSEPDGTFSPCGGVLNPPSFKCIIHLHFCFCIQYYIDISHETPYPMGQVSTLRIVRSSSVSMRSVYIPHESLALCFVGAVLGSKPGLRRTRWAIAISQVSDNYRILFMFYEAVTTLSTSPLCSCILQDPASPNENTYFPTPFDCM